MSQALYKINRKKRNINKPIILSLDIAGTFDSVHMKIIFEAIKLKKKWKAEKNGKGSRNVVSIFKPGMWIFNNNDIETIRIQKKESSWWLNEPIVLYHFTWIHP